MAGSRDAELRNLIRFSPNPEVLHGIFLKKFTGKLVFTKQNMADIQILKVKSSGPMRQENSPLGKSHSPIWPFRDVNIGFQGFIPYLNERAGAASTSKLLCYYSAHSLRSICFCEATGLSGMSQTGKPVRYTDRITIAD